MDRQVNGREAAKKMRSAVEGAVRDKLARNVTGAATKGERAVIAASTARGDRLGVNWPAN